MIENRVYFRAFELDDWKHFHSYRSDDLIYSNIVGNKYFVSAEREKKWIEAKIFNDKTEIYLAVCLKENDKCIGYTSINDINLRNLNAVWGSIFLDKDERMKGLSIDVGVLLLKLVFEELPIHRFYSYILESHIGSLRMVEKLGFKIEGVQRESVYKLNKFHNVIGISILKHEYNDKYLGK